VGQGAVQPTALTQIDDLQAARHSTGGSELREETQGASEPVPHATCKRRTILSSPYTICACAVINKHDKSSIFAC
jgi:hypothetical protein